MTATRMRFLCESCAEGLGLELDGAKLVRAVCAMCGQRCNCIVAIRPTDEGNGQYTTAASARRCICSRVQNASRISCPSQAMQLHPEAVSEFRFIQPCRPIPAKAVPAGDG